MPSRPLGSLGRHARLSRITYEIAARYVPCLRTSASPRHPDRTVWTFSVSRSGPDSFVLIGRAMGDFSELGLVPANHHQIVLQADEHGATIPFAMRAASRRRLRQYPGIAGRRLINRMPPGARSRAGRRVCLARGCGNLGRAGNPSRPGSLTSARITGSLYSAVFAIGVDGQDDFVAQVFAEAPQRVHHGC